MRLHARDMAASTECRIIGDVWYMPRRGDVDEYALACHRVPPHLATNSLFDPSLLQLQTRFFEEYDYQHNVEPAWIDEVTDEAQRFIRFAFYHDRIEPLSIVFELPFTGLSYMVSMGGLAEDVDRSFNLRRLQGVAQLAFLQAPGGIEGIQIDSGRFRHTRYLHSLDVYAIATMIATQNDLSERDAIHLRVAALVHDVLTPAGGDTTKRINLTMFDEDANFRYLFTWKAEGWNFLKNKYNLSEDLLEAIVQGKGLLGQLHDLADKLAYVSRDVDNFLTKLPRSFYDELSVPREAIRGIISRNKLICGLWGDIEIDGEQVVIRDWLTLKDFLMVRALMFSVLYYNPQSRFLEDCLARIAIEHVLFTGRFTKADLLDMKDEQLIEVLEQEVLGVEGHLSDITPNYDPHVETFATMAEAIERETVLAGNKDILSVVRESKTLTTNGVGRFLVRIEQEVKTLAEADPKAVAAIIAVMEDKRPVRLYWFSKKHLHLPRALIARLQRERRARMAAR